MCIHVYIHIQIGTREPAFYELFVNDGVENELATPENYARREREKKEL